MGKTWTCVSLVFVVGCQSLYGAPAQKLRTPEPVKPPAELPGTPETVVYAESCEFFVVKVKQPITRKTKQADVHTREADKKLGDFDVAPPEAKRDLIVEGIDELVAALRNDPFNAKATLRLALAYDKVRRKGCALALLERLEQLAQNPKFAGEANDAIEEILQRGNRKWFAGYRKEAVRAVGRPGHP